MNAYTTTHAEEARKLFENIFENGFVMNKPANILSKTPQYPPFNAYMDGNDQVLEFALAGFSKDNIDVTFDGSTLTLTVEKEDEFPGEEERQYIRHGISRRAFTRSWTVSSDFEVQDPKFKDGILTLRFNSVKSTPQQLTIKSK